MRRDILDPGHFVRPYDPRLIAIDDFSSTGTTASRVLETAKILGLDGYLLQIASDFRGCGETIDTQFKPFDFVWFDCGGPQEYVAFLQEYWQLCAPHALHFTYQWQEGAGGEKNIGVRLAPGAVLTELKRQHQRAGVDAGFEILSLVEPHKTRQGSVTVLRRVHDAVPVSPEPTDGAFQVTP